MTVLIPTVFAEEQVPGFVVAVEGDPYYFSANDMGIGILQYFERDYTPYLVPGVTDETSTIDEIMEAYDERRRQSTPARADRPSRCRRSASRPIRPLPRRLVSPATAWAGSPVTPNRA